MRRGLSPSAALGRHIFLGLTSAFVLLPFIWMVSTSLKSPNEIFQEPTLASLIPREWNIIENYGTVFDKAPMLLFMWNGLIVCFGIVAFQLAIAFPCAYALAKFRFPGKKALFAAVLTGLLIPGQVLVLPLFILIYYFGLLDTRWALILPNIISVFGIFLFRQFFKQVPDELIFAGRLDGMSELGIIWRVVVPMAMPAILAFSAFSISGHWNDLLWPMVVVQSPELATPPLGLVFFQSAETGTNYGGLMAGAVVVVAPLVILFLLAQRWFIAGIKFSGGK